MSSLTRWAVLHSGCGRRSLSFGSSWRVGGVSSSCLCRATQHQMSICWHWTAGFDLHWLHRRRNACGYTVPLSNSQYVCSRVYCIAVKLSVCLSTLCLDKIRVSAQVIIFATARTLTDWTEAIVIERADLCGLQCDVTINRCVFRKEDCLFTRVPLMLRKDLILILFFFILIYIK